MKPDPDLERLLAEEEAIEKHAKELREGEAKVQALLSSLAWAADIAVNAEQAEVLESIAAVVRFARGLH